MKKLIRPAILIGLTIFLAMSCTMIAFSTKPAAFTNSVVGAVRLAQTTSTPQVEEDNSEVGSTDGIVIMGGVIALIILLPIFARRKSWIPARKT